MDLSVILQSNLRTSCKFA